MTMTIHRRKPPRNDPHLMLMRDRVFAPLAKWERFKRICDYEVAHDEACYVTAVAYQTVPMIEIPPTVRVQVEAFRYLIRGARVTYRMHIATCPNCGAVRQRPSLHVEMITSDGFTLSREFAV